MGTKESDSSITLKKENISLYHHKDKNTLLYSNNKEDFLKYFNLTNDKKDSEDMESQSNVIELNEENILKNQNNKTKIKCDKKVGKKKKKKKKGKSIIDVNSNNVNYSNKIESIIEDNDKKNLFDNKINSGENKNKNLFENKISTSFLSLNNSTPIQSKDVDNVLIDETSIANITETKIKRFLQNKRERLDIASYNDFVVKFDTGKRIIIQIIDKLQNIINDKKNKLKVKGFHLEKEEMKNLIGFNNKSEFNNIGNLFNLLINYKIKLQDPEFITKFRRYLCQKNNCPYGEFCCYAHTKEDLIIPESNRSYNENKTKKRGICKYYFYNKLCLAKNCPYNHIDA